jgi:deoxyribodipyrimidine photo-lyase
MNQINIFWFRRDLRLTDNTGLFHAINSKNPVLPIFIFDTQILNELDEDDARVSFIHQKLKEIDEQLKDLGSSLKIYYGDALEIWEKIIEQYDLKKVFTNKDYEPYAIKRDQEIASFLGEKGVEFQAFKDQVIFEESEVMKDDGTPYTIFTPYSKKWRSLLKPEQLKPLNYQLTNLHSFTSSFPSLEDIGFKTSSVKVIDYRLEHLDDYETVRNYPAQDATSYLSPHLRFGTIGIRELFHKILSDNTSFTNELIWREFFMQILFHFPDVVEHNFKRKYDGVQWRNNEEDFKKWCSGETGYPMVDAGMRQLNETGYMHNRVRMVVASFLCKHLLIDWRWGEAYFAKKLLDYELSANNGNWQWAAGTGCDAAPYFRVFNPTEQIKKFDSKMTYIKKWVPEMDELNYRPMIDHKFARERALEVYKTGLNP